MTSVWLVLLLITAMCCDVVYLETTTVSEALEETTVMDLDVVTSSTVDVPGARVYKVPRRQKHVEVALPPRTRWVGDALHDAVGRFVPQGGSRACERHSQLYRQGLEDLTLWAVQSE